MSHFFHGLLGLSVVASLFFCQSCKDNDYYWDDINTNGVIPIPPIPIGSIDTVWMNTLTELPSIPPIELPGEGLTAVYEYTIYDIFGEDVVEKLFYEGAKDITLEGLADILVLKANSNLRVGIKFSVLDSSYNTIDAIKIPDQNHLVYGKDQDLSILFESKYMKYFEKAAHLKLDIVTKANLISTSPKDYILLKKMILKTGGIHVEL